MLWNSDQIYIDLWKVIWIQVSTSHWTQELQSTTDPGQSKVLKSRENNITYAIQQMFFTCYQLTHLYSHHIQQRNQHITIVDKHFKQSELQSKVFNQEMFNYCYIFHYIPHEINI